MNGEYKMNYLGDGQIISNAIIQLIGKGLLRSREDFCARIGQTIGWLNHRIYGQTPLSVDERWQIINIIFEIDEDVALWIARTMTMLPNLTYERK
jgi:hypothetical protein